MKIITILGARPQFIKAAVVSRELKKRNEKFEEIIIHTGQHYDKNMSEVFFNQMDIPKPKYNLQIAGLSHGAMTGRMVEGIEKIILKENPGVILLYGDTNSTLAGAIAAVKIGVPIAHIEAGLRSGNLEMPEEINRVITDRVSNILFCPSENAVENLTKESFPNILKNKNLQKIVNVGDVMCDAIKYYEVLAKESIDIKKIIGDVNKSYILCTIHRQENTDNLENMKEIFNALNEIADEIDVVIPMHPRLKLKIEIMGINIEKLNIINPQPYLEMQRLQMEADLIITDSGGVQKEAFFHKIPCLTIRKETEWSETLTSGWNKLACPNKDQIIKTWKTQYLPSSEFDGVYGDGNAAEKIVNELEKMAWS